MPRCNEVPDRVQCRFYILGGVEELHDDRQIKRQIEQRGCMRFARLAKSGNTPIHRDAHYFVIVVESLEDLLVNVPALGDLDARDSYFHS